MDSHEDAPIEDEPSEPATSSSHRGDSRGFIRRHKALTVLIALAAVFAVIVAGLGIWFWSLNGKIDDIPRFEADFDREDRPPREQPKDALNVLLVGVDGRGTDVRERLEAGDTGLLSDTMMIWHLEEDHENSQVVSFPRDSWVDIEGYGQAKLNAAFSYGGPELLVQTLEDTLDIYIDHVAVVDFEGFKDITDTLGGVDLETADGGEQHFDGDEALEYVRERKSLPGGDFDRIDRQQNFLREVLHKATSTGTRMNPLTVNGLIGDLGKLLVLDDDFSNGEIRDLGLDVVTQGAGEVVWMTAFNNGTGYEGDQSVVYLDIEKSRELMAAISKDEFKDYVKDNPVDRLPKPEDVN